MVVRDTSASVEAPLISRVRYFDPHEANRALIYVRRITKDVIDTYKEVIRLRLRIEHQGHLDQGSNLEDSYKGVMIRLSDLVEELHQVGVEIKDFEEGYVDFPAMSDDGELFLCWKLGETDVDHWHHADIDCEDREPLATLPTLIG
ncbi:DUF2203 domain-containing protein [Mucisphaera calidilacus]|uniref:DUF2203 family protein n=1 Tax=Mucisphaera calidilacus TaxID=2527982 RepID=A0A518BW90_9BACT|nr:DUF2203 domain-containing protein [Mucisphaera calidilacus]QDU71249.1 hypothetical protein Pan265_10980 [Mucisphaera calidilacus]